MKEQLNQHGYLGYPKHLWDVYKPINTQERIETASLVLVVGALALSAKAIYDSTRTIDDYANDVLR